MQGSIRHSSFFILAGSRREPRDDNELGMKI